MAFIFSKPASSQTHGSQHKCQTCSVALGPCLAEALAAMGDGTLAAKHCGGGFIVQHLGGCQN